MSAAAVPVRAPLFQEGAEYWDALIDHCRRQTSAINAVASEHGISPNCLLECRLAPQSYDDSRQSLEIVKSTCPSTRVSLSINYCSWGPMIDVTISGREGEDREFCPEEFSVPVAKDLDGSVIAIYDEGRSFSPRELAAYVMRAFRRCYPELSLPV